MTGAFASVYRLRCDDRDVALRCFLRNSEDRKLRYEQISEFLSSREVPYTVPFHYMEEGIQTNSCWTPAIKMEWLQGHTLDQFLQNNLENSECLERLEQSFLKMMQDLREFGIAHGDLQHGNILVLKDGSLRLLDYDGMFVPSMSQRTTEEIGHASYQHPSRTKNDFGPYLDNFPAWIIYTSILACRIDPRLWNDLGAGDDALLFRASDFNKPMSSPAFAALENHDDPKLARLGKFVRYQLGRPVREVEFVREEVENVVSLGLIPAGLPRTRKRKKHLSRRRAQEENKDFFKPNLNCTPKAFADLSLLGTLALLVAVTLFCYPEGSLRFSDWAMECNRKDAFLFMPVLAYTWFFAFLTHVLPSRFRGLLIVPFCFVVASSVCLGTSVAVRQRQIVAPGNPEVWIRTENRNGKDSQIYRVGQEFTGEPYWRARRELDLGWNMKWVRSEAPASEYEY